MSEHASVPPEQDERLRLAEWCRGQAKGERLREAAAESAGWEIALAYRNAANFEAIAGALDAPHAHDPVYCVGCRSLVAFTLSRREAAALDAPRHSLGTALPRDRKPAVYVASKTKHAQMWRGFRDAGRPIISTWIDEAGEGETKSWAELWQRIVAEVQRATALILYADEGEELKGALLEVGIALGAGKRVVLLGSKGWTFDAHPQCVRAADIGEALDLACAIDGALDAAPLHRRILELEREIEAANEITVRLSDVNLAVELAEANAKIDVLREKLVEISKAIGYDESWIDSATCNVVAHAITTLQDNYIRLRDERAALDAPRTPNAIREHQNNLARYFGYEHSGTCRARHNGFPDDENCTKCAAEISVRAFITRPMVDGALDAAPPTNTDATVAYVIGEEFHGENCRFWGALFQTPDKVAEEQCDCWKARLREALGVRDAAPPKEEK